MGIEPFLIGYAINLIVAQRLLRKLCDNCKRRVQNFDEELMEAAGLNIEEWENYEIYEAVGCEKCNKTGYKGRMAIHEALYFTKEIKNLIVKAGVEIDEEKIREQARKDGTLSLREAGFEKVKMGLTSIPEVIATTMEE
jgi:type IV pilus assembly protein PilB